jgi:hypothetical protein
MTKEHGTTRPDGRPDGQDSEGAPPRSLTPSKIPTIPAPDSEDERQLKFKYPKWGRPKRHE